MLSFDELYLFDDESDDDGSGPGYPGTCDFTYCSGTSGCSTGKSVGHVFGIASGVFFPTGIESIGDVFTLVAFVPRGVEFKGGRLIELFWRPKS